MMPRKKAPRKSRVNEAGNYTKPTMRKNLFNKIKASNKEEPEASGRLVRLKCLRNSTKRRVEAIETDGP